MHLIRSGRLCVLAALALSTQASAQMGPPDFATLDADRNGQVTRGEVATGTRPMFDRIDRNRNGSITRGEMRRFAMGQMFGGGGGGNAQPRGPRPDLDFDANGELSHARFVDGIWRAQFAPRDANRDGSISRAEYDAGQAARR
jgi:EF hand